METKELKITIPEGQEIDWQESAKQEKIVFKKKDTKPRTWEEYCEQHNTTVTNRYFIDNSAEVRVTGWHPDIPSDMLKNTLPTKELAEAFLAMMQLMSLRQAWIDDWKPNYCVNTASNWCIEYEPNPGVFSITNHCKTNGGGLTFPTREMTKDFMNCFKDLLEIAKPLI